jgi:hypothetical protein
LLLLLPLKELLPLLLLLLLVVQELKEHILSSILLGLELPLLVLQVLQPNQRNYILLVP